MHVGTRAVELSIWHDNPNWRWEVSFGGQNIDVGASNSKVAAKWASQNACTRFQMSPCIYNESGFAQTGIL